MNNFRYWYLLRFSLTCENWFQMGHEGAGVVVFRFEIYRFREFFTFSCNPFILFTSLLINLGVGGIYLSSVNFNFVAQSLRQIQRVVFNTSCDLSVTMLQLFFFNSPRSKQGQIACRMFFHSCSLTIFCLFRSNHRKKNFFRAFFQK